MPPLAVPAEGSPDGEDPLRYGAVLLFVERASAATPSFSPDARVAATMAGICRRLDGIPLAIELAAARAAVLGIAGLAARLDDRFTLLTGGRRTALPRHQTLRATLDWSYELLPEPERLVLRRLAVFAGGFTIPAASAVAADDAMAASEVVDCVTSLVPKSLVTADAGGAMVRYRLLETTRAYALEKLVQAGEFDAAARRHAERYLDLFEGAEAAAAARPTDEWLADYVPRMDNLRAALNWAFSDTGDALDRRGANCCRGALVDALVIDGGVPRPGRAGSCRDRSRSGRGRAPRDATPRRARDLADVYQGRRPFRDRRGRDKGPRDRREICNAVYWLRSLFGLFSFSINSGQHRDALTLAQRFHTLAATRSDPIDCLIGERMIGASQYYLGELVSARRHVERVLVHSVAPAQKSEISRFEGDEWVQAQAYLARTPWPQGLPDQAMPQQNTVSRNARATNHAISLGLVLLGAACLIALWVGDLTAAEHYAEILARRSELDRRCLAGVSLAVAIRNTRHPARRCRYRVTAAARRLRRTSRSRVGPAVACVPYFGGLGSCRADRRRAPLFRGGDHALRAHRRTLAQCRVAAHQGRAFCLRQGAPEPRRRPRVTSVSYSTGHIGKKLCPGSCAPPQASPDCGATRPGVTRLVRS